MSNMQNRQIMKQPILGYTYATAVYEVFSVMFLEFLPSSGKRNVDKKVHKTTFIYPVLLKSNKRSSASINSCA